MNRILSFLLISVFLLALFACGGGGGGGGGGVAPLSLTGTLTDHTQDGVAGASVTVTNATGAVVASTTTNGAGGYQFRGLPTDTPLTVTFDSIVAGFFPVTAQVSLVSGTATVLDMFLHSTRDRATGQMHADTSIVDSLNAGGTADSGTFIDAGEFASLAVPAASLMSGLAAYDGAATVYITPIDVGSLGNGFAPYQVVLPLAVGDFYPDDFPQQVLQLFASAAFEVYASPAGTELGIDASNPVTLTMPIPSEPVELRVNAPDILPLWRFDELAHNWEEVDTADLDDLVTPTAYIADVSEPGIYVAGLVAVATEFTGTLVFDDTLDTPAAGVTVFVNGAGGDVYQQITTSAADGTFSALIMDGGSFDLDCVAWGNGVQLLHQEQGLVAADLATPVTLTGITDAPSDATITLDGLDENDPNTIGFIPASGRLYVETDDLGNTDFVAISDVADVNFVADIFPGDSLTIQPAATGSEIKLFGSTVWDTAPIDLPAGTADVVVDVKTGDATPFYARITIDEVTQSIGGNIWTVTFRSQFSLTPF